MTLQKYLIIQPPEKQNEIFKRLTIFLNTEEIKRVMDLVKGGMDLLTAHRGLGLLEKYQVELLKICDILNRRN